MNTDILTMILIIVAIILLGVLVFVFIEVIRTIRKVRATLDELMPSVNEAVTRVNTVIATLEPSLKHIDPLLERASLTVDAVNLEIMRVDQILTDISDVTDVASGAAKKVSGIAEAPLNLLTSATDRIRNVFSDRRSEKRHARALSEAEKRQAELALPQASLADNAQVPVSSFGSGENQAAVPEEAPVPTPMPVPTPTPTPVPTPTPTPSQQFKPQFAASDGSAANMIEQIVSSNQASVSPSANPASTLDEVVQTSDVLLRASASSASSASSTPSTPSAPAPASSAKAVPPLGMASSPPPAIPNKGF